MFRRVAVGAAELAGVRQARPIIAWPRTPNLGVMIKQDPIIGLRFRVPINYGSLPHRRHRQRRQQHRLGPHNGVLYVWMRMGVLGELALWMFVAAAILAGTRAGQVGPTARSP